MDVRHRRHRPPGHAARDQRHHVRHGGQGHHRARAGNREGDLAVHGAGGGQPARRRLLARRSRHAAAAVQLAPAIVCSRVDAERGKPAAGFGDDGLGRSQGQRARRRRRRLQPRLAAVDLQEHRHHRRQQRRAVAELRPVRRHPRLGCAHRQAALVVSHRAARRRAGRRDVGRRELEEPIRHERLVVLHHRHRARHRLRADRRADVRLLRRRSQGREPVRQLHRRARRDDRHAEVAPAARAPRPLGLRRAGRADARRRQAQRPHDSRGRRHDEDGAGVHLRSRHRRADLRRRRTAGAAEHRAGRSDLADAAVSAEAGAAGAQHVRSGEGLLHADARARRRTARSCGTPTRCTRRARTRRPASTARW